MSAVNVTLLTFAAECSAVTSAAAPLVVYVQRSATNPPHVGLRLHDGTDSRTDAKPYHRLYSFCSHADGCSIVIPAAICDPSVYSAYQPCMTSQHFTFPYPYITHRHTSLDPPPFECDVIYDVHYVLYRKSYSRCQYSWHWHGIFGHWPTLTLIYGTLWKKNLLKL